MRVIPIVRLTVVCASALFGFGCAAALPLTSALTGTAPSSSLQVLSQTSIRLEQGNFVTVRTNLVGTSKGFKLLGFITLRPASVNVAMNELYAHAEAQPGTPQTLANVMIEQSGIYVILFSIPRVTVRADLIQFLMEPHEEDSDPEEPSRPLGNYPVVRRTRQLQ